MLTIFIPAQELFNEKDSSFIYVKDTKLQLEHSLLSISKWESKWHKPFLSKEEKTQEEIMDYIKCMTVTQNIIDDLYALLTNEDLKKISDYINDPMTATWFNERNENRSSREQITSELIYYWMIAQNIPFSCEKWHINRLLTLIRVCTIKNTPPKKMSQSEILRRNSELNAQRKALWNTRG